MSTSAEAEIVRSASQPQPRLRDESNRNDS